MEKMSTRISKTEVLSHSIKLHHLRISWNIIQYIVSQYLTSGSFFLLSRSYVLSWNVVVYLDL